MRDRVATRSAPVEVRATQTEEVVILARALVAGGMCLREENPELDGALVRFAAALHRELVARGHAVLGGC